MITPDSTDVILLPTTEKVKISEEDTGPNLEKIVSETLSILEMHQKRCTEMQQTAQKRLYMIHRIHQSVQLYANHLERLKNFFFQHDQIQFKWCEEFLYRLPKYGDYLKVLGPKDETVEVEGFPEEGSRTEVRDLVEEVVDAVYDGGKFVFSQRALCKAIDISMRSKLLTDYVDPLTRRSLLLKTIDAEQQRIRDVLSELNAYVNFLQIDQLEPIIDDFKLTTDFGNS